MAIKVNKKFLAIKLHYFFFNAALGPIIPQIQVFGRQMGTSASMMGVLLSVLPILYFFAKPIVGIIADYFMRARKIIFIGIVAVMTISFGCFIFLPYQTSKLHFRATYILSCSSSMIVDQQVAFCLNLHSVQCSHRNESYNFKLTTVHEQKVLCDNALNSTQHFDEQTELACHITGDSEAPTCFYKSFTFWCFVFLTYVGTIGFNVGNSISDAVCFDVLGRDNQSKYGYQRVWGAIGWGLSSFLSGYLVDQHSNDFTPAVLIMMACAVIDMVIIKALNMPKLSSSETIYKDVKKLLKNRDIAIFLVFATIVGILDSFIFYFTFWFLEEAAEKIEMTEHIKFIEGIVVAAQTAFGEVIFFMISGKIIRKLGYINTMTFCLFCYALRLYTISLITNPWNLIIIEILMQGSTYALCYTSIVAYASVITPPGASATVQGIVAGMDDGLGFTIGSLLGGFLYQSVGGSKSFKIYSLLALLTCFANMFRRNPAILYVTNDEEAEKEGEKLSEEVKLNKDDNTVTEN